MDVRTAPSEGFQVFVHIVDALAAQQPQAPPQDLRCRPVIDLQALRTTGDVDPDLLERDTVVVDALMGVTDHEEVVGA